jgi:hypothetical protein
MQRRGVRDHLDDDARRLDEASRMNLDPFGELFPVSDPNRFWKYAGVYLGAFIAIVFAIGAAIGFLIGL